MLQIRLLIVLISAVASAAAAPATQPAKPAAKAVATDLSVKDIADKDRQPLASGDSKAAVLFFLAHDCPISNGYSPEINRLCQEFGGKITFHIIHPYADLDVEEAREHTKEYRYTAPVVIDTQRQVTRAVGAKTTPEAIVLSPAGKVLYRGRIDNTWADYGKRRPEPTVRDLREALSAILDGKPVPTPVTEAIGCPIEP